MIKILWFSMLVLFVAGKVNAEIWVRNSSTNMGEFNAAILLSPKVEPYSQWLVKHRVPLKQIRDLEDDMKLAQSEFLSGSIEKSVQYFRKIVAYEGQADWKQDQRQAFAYSHLRLAQMAGDQDSRTQELKAAARWGSLEIPEELFPMALIAEYRQILQNRFKEKLDLDLWFPGARFLLIDGMPIEVNASAEAFVDAFEHRFTLIYDDRVAVSNSLSWGELKKWRPESTTLSSGTCENPVWNTKPDSLDAIRFFFGSHCVLNWRQNMGAALAKSSDELILPKPMIEKEKVKSNHWLWIAAGAIALGYVLAEQSQHDSSASPTTSVGF